MEMETQRVVGEDSSNVRMPDELLKRLLLISDYDTEWMGRAACKGKTEIMYPGPGSPEGNHQARKICMGCPVLDNCLDYAIEHNERIGIWGGLSAKARSSKRRGLQNRHVEGPGGVLE